MYYIKKIALLSFCFSIPIIAVMSFFYYRNSYEPSAQPVSSFFDCKKSEGAIIEQSQPVVCVSKTGERFTDITQVSAAK